MHSALFAATETLRTFLQEKMQSVTEITDVLGATIFVTSANPSEVIESKRHGLSVWLYRVVRDEDLLNAPPEMRSGMQLRQPPLPMRLHYLITPIVESDVSTGPEMEQRMLGRVLQALYDEPRFVGSALLGGLAGTTVELIARLEQLTLEEITRVWDALDAPYQLSVSYEVTIARIDSERVETFVPVQTVEPAIGVIVAAPN